MSVSIQTIIKPGSPYIRARVEYTGQCSATDLLTRIATDYIDGQLSNFDGMTHIFGAMMNGPMNIYQLFIKEN